MFCIKGLAQADLQRRKLIQLITVTTKKTGYIKEVFFLNSATGRSDYAKTSTKSD